MRSATVAGNNIMAYSLARMTLYALICGIEEDLRALIVSHMGEIAIDDTPIAGVLIENAKSRYHRENGPTVAKTTVRDLVEFLDFGDTYQLINSNRVHFPEELSINIRKITGELDKIAPVRNRVMHMRPLMFDDTAFVTEFCKELVRGRDTIWNNLSDILKKIADNPSFVLNLDIPRQPNEQGPAHNLPLPDFDETGLIGRNEEISKLRMLINGPYPVISIVGEGGIGKSSLALKVAYDLLDEVNNKFDAVIWVSSKTTQITATEIREISGAIRDSFGVFQTISDRLSGAEIENPMTEILEYLATFRIALFIDNLETIMDAKIRSFMEGLPQGSKVVITSRIGLGAFEYPIKLTGIKETHATQLLRMLVKARGIEALQKKNDQILAKHCARMHYNPGYIKWFVSALQTGRQPEEVLQNSALFLEFCMSNVFEHLSADAKLLIETMLSVPGWRDTAELAYLSDFDSIKVTKSLQELMSTNMISESSKVIGNIIKTTYQLSELARAFVKKHHVISKDTQEKIKKNRNSLNALIEGADFMNYGKNSAYNIKIRSKSDKVIAKMLVDSIRDIYAGRFSEAFTLLEEAKRLAPDYFEVSRVQALLHAERGNYADARASYELAIELEPTHPDTRYWYGQFLMKEDQSIEEAAREFEHFIKVEPDTKVMLDLARCYLFLHRFDECEKLMVSVRDAMLKLDRFAVIKYHDTFMQLHYRRADDAHKTPKYGEAIISLKRMMDYFNSIPGECKDHIIRKKITKAKYITDYITRNINLSRDELRDIRSIQEFIRHEGSFQDW